MTRATRSISDVVAEVIQLVESVDDKERLLRTIGAYFGSALVEAAPSAAASQPAKPVSQVASGYSAEHNPSPKQFLFEKKPTTDVERIACLAYFLTHFRQTPHFKTNDLTQLNTEAAQVRFSNAALAANNALKLGYLTHATKAHKQLSALGEQYVQTLPDRDAARLKMSAGRKQRSKRRSYDAKASRAQ